MKPRNTTDVLDGGLENEDDKSWIVQRFWKTAQKAIRDTLPHRMSGKIDQDELVGISLHEAIENARRNPKALESSNSFWGLVARSAKGNAIDVLRRHTTQKRDISREVSLGGLGDHDLLPGRDVDPAVSAELNELLEHATGLVEAEEDPILLLINRHSEFGNASIADIHTKLVDVLGPDVAPIPSLIKGQVGKLKRKLLEMGKRLLK